MLAPLRTAGRNQINAAYSGVPQRLADKMLAFGGRSGKFGRAMREAEMGRLSSLSGFEGDLAGMGLQAQMGGASLAEQLLGMDFGSTMTGKTTMSPWNTVLSGLGLAAGIAGGGGGGGGSLLSGLFGARSGASAGASIYDLPLGNSSGKWLGMFGP